METAIVENNTIEVSHHGVKYNAIQTATTNLVVGDRVLFHGAIFELVNPEWYENNTVVNFDTVLISENLDYKSFPLSWQKEWHVQGNKYATMIKLV